MVPPGVFPAGNHWFTALGDGGGLRTTAPAAMSQELIKTAILGVFAVLVIVAALKDLSSFTIPNWISIALALAFAPAALAAGVSLAAVGISFAVAFAVLVLAAGMFALGWIGGGDAKLMAASAL